MQWGVLRLKRSTTLYRFQEPLQGCYWKISCKPSARSSYLDLTFRYNGQQTLSIFDGMVKLDVNLTLHLIFKKFVNA